MTRFGIAWDQLTTGCILQVGWQDFLLWEAGRGRYLDDTMTLRGDWLAKSTVVAIKWKFTMDSFIETGEYEQ